MMRIWLVPHTWQKHAIFLPTIATVKQSQLPIFSLLLSFIMFPYVLKNTKYCQKNRHQGALLDEYAAPGGAEDIWKNEM